MPRRHLGTLQQIAEAKDAIQGSAQFVAHIGEELGLYAIGFLCRLARHIQLNILYFDGFQRLLKILGGLINVLLQLTLSAL